MTTTYRPPIIRLFDDEIAVDNFAGVDMDPDDIRLCGKCGPCEANKLLRRIDARARLRKD